MSVKWFKNSRCGTIPLQYLCDSSRASALVSDRRQNLLASIYFHVETMFGENEPAPNGGNRGPSASDAVPMGTYHLRRWHHVVLAGMTILSSFFLVRPRAGKAMIDAGMWQYRGYLSVT
jgi:hypothetical protein